MAIELTVAELERHKINMNENVVGGGVSDAGFPDHPAAIFEPTCACCTVGSYASLSVCLSVTLPKFRLDNNSYLRKYYS